MAKLSDEQEINFALSGANWAYTGDKNGLRNRKTEAICLFAAGNLEEFFFFNNIETPLTILQKYITTLVLAFVEGRVFMTMEC